MAKKVMKLVVKQKKKIKENSKTLVLLTAHNTKYKKTINKEYLNKKKDIKICTKCFFVQF